MQLSGIDKTAVKGFSVQGVDFERLQQSNRALIIRDTKKSLYDLWNGDKFEYIKIKDENIFKTFQAGIKLTGNTYICYSSLDLSIAPLKSNNLVPLSITAYRKQLSRVFEYLENMYGVKCGMLDNLKFETLELNATIQLNDQFDKYIRIFQVLMSVAPKVYKEKNIFEDRISNSVKGLAIKNKSLAVKFYNKSKQMKEVYEIDIEKNILRIEYTFSQSRKIVDVFGTCKVYEISDIQIKNFIIDRFTSDFVKPYNKLKAENKTKLKRLIRQYKAKNKNWINKIKEYFWLAESENKLTVLLDIEDFLELIRNEDQKNYARNRKKILKEFPNTYFNQHEKYEEIFNKITVI